MLRSACLQTGAAGAPVGLMPKRQAGSAVTTARAPNAPSSARATAAAATAVARKVRAGPWSWPCQGGSSWAASSGEFGELRHVETWSSSVTLVFTDGYSGVCQLVFLL